MRIQIERRRPGQLDHELIWLSVTLLSAGALAAWFALHLPWPRCTFRALLGVPCLTCGSTRAALAFLHGDLLASWRFNPLALLTFCGLAIFDLYALTVLSSRAPRLRFAALEKNQRRAATILIALALLLNWVYLLRHP
ncbi:MAG TPA: DUF2752 domain-containing protein [Chthoniobacterales bacterium]|nr:DUF2752 domain-containing protein [Chthoniobacterales bacterium]